MGEKWSPSPRLLSAYTQPVQLWVVEMGHCDAKVGVRDQKEGQAKAKIHVDGAIPHLGLVIPATCGMYFLSPSRGETYGKIPHRV